MQYQFTINIEELAPNNACAVIWPKPPLTHFQQLIDCQLGCETVNSSSVVTVTDKNFDQAAFIQAIQNNHKNSSHAPAKQFSQKASYTIKLKEDNLNTDHLITEANGSLAQTADVSTCHNKIQLLKATQPEQHKTNIIIDFLANEFSYLHHEDELNRVPLVCTHLAGDCLDINTALMKLLLIEKIPSAYYIGLFFEDENNQEHPATFPSIDDWHCWVSTLSDDKKHVLDWDIAHHLKRNISPVAASLNPVHGIRVALSSGRDLQFDYQGNTINISHLGAPLWLLNNGNTQQAKFSSTLAPAPLISEHQHINPMEEISKEVS